MQIGEMHQYINLKLQEVGAYKERVFLPEEIDVYINSTIVDLIRERLPLNTKQLNFQNTNKLDDDLQTLYKVITYAKEELVEEDENAHKVYAGILPNDYFIRTALITEVTICGENNRSKCRIVEQESLYENLANPFATTKAESALATIENNKFKIYTKGRFELNKAILSYIKTPASVRNGSSYIQIQSNVNCDLPTAVHSLICEKTIYNLLESLKSNRISTNPSTFQTV